VVVKLRYPFAEHSEDIREKVSLKDNIFAAVVYGMLPGQVPDTGSTAALFIIAIGALLLTYDAQWRRNA
jgi:hypothetical protein